MPPRRITSAVTIPCPFCCLTFTKTVHLARHVQLSHKNESRCAAVAAATAAVTSAFSRTSLADMAAAPGPPLLEAVVGEANEEYAPVSLANARILGGAASGVPAPDVEETGKAVFGGTVFDSVGVPPCEDSSSGGSGIVGNGLFSSDTEVDGGAATAHGSFIGTAAAEVRAAGSPAGGLPRHVFLSSTGARIRSYYLRLPETSRSTPVVHSSWARRPSRFTSPAM